MAYSWFLQHWLRTVAEQKLRETVVQTAREHLAAQAEAAAGPTPPCDVGVLFALASEAGGLEDLLAGVVRIKGHGFAVCQGELKHRQVAIAVSGAGRDRAARAAEALLAGHRPPWLISAGFCGGLSPELPRHAIVLADALLDGQGNRLEVDLGKLDPGLVSRQGVHVGPILQVEQVIRRPADKRAAGEAHRALAADLESLAVAEVCRGRNVSFLAIRLVSDAVDDELPREVEKLLHQKSRTAQFGAALGAILDRPGSLKEMYQLHANALVASDRLARFLAAVIQHIIPLPPAPG